MRAPAIHWKEQVQRYGPAMHVGYVGKVRGFSITASLSKSGEFNLNPTFPGYKIKTFKSVGEAQAYAQRVADEFLSLLHDWSHL